MDPKNKENITQFELFLRDILTLEDLVYLIDEIRTIYSLLYKTEGRFLSQKIKGRVSVNLYEIILSLEQKKAIPFQVADIEKFLNSLKTYLENIPKVTLTLAFKPHKDFIRYLYTFFQAAISEKIILEIVVRQEIIGGA